MQRIARETNERRKNLAAMPKGFYTVSLSAFIHTSWRDYVYEGYAENGYEAYKAAVATLKEMYSADLLTYDDILDAEIIPSLSR